MEKEKSRISTEGKISIGIASLAAFVYVTKKIYKFKEDPANKGVVDAIKAGWKIFIAYVVISSLVLFAAGLVYVLYTSIAEGVFNNLWNAFIALLMLASATYSFRKKEKKK